MAESLLREDEILEQKYFPSVYSSNIHFDGNYNFTNIGLFTFLCDILKWTPFPNDYFFLVFWNVTLNTKLLSWYVFWKMETSLFVWNLIAVFRVLIPQKLFSFYSLHFCIVLRFPKLQFTYFGIHGTTENISLAISTM